MSEVVVTGGHKSGRMAYAAKQVFDRRMRGDTTPILIFGPGHTSLADYFTPEMLDQMGATITKRDEKIQVITFTDEDLERERNYQPPKTVFVAISSLSRSFEMALALDKMVTRAMIEDGEAVFTVTADGGVTLAERIDVDLCDQIFERNMRSAGLNGDEFPSVLSVAERNRRLGPPKNKPSYLQHDPTKTHQRVRNGGKR